MLVYPVNKFRKFVNKSRDYEGICSFGTDLVNTTV